MSDNKRDIYVLHSICEFGLDPYEFRIVCRIARRGEQYPESAAEIAKACLMSRRKVMDVLPLLERARILEKQSRIGQATVYRVRPYDEWASPAEFAKLRTNAPDAHPAPAPDAQGYAPDAHPPVQQVHIPCAPDAHMKESKERVKEKEREREQAQEGLPLIGLVPERPHKPKGRQDQGPQEKTESPADRAHQRLMAKRVELFGKTPNMGQEAKALKAMLDDGFTEDQIAECMADMAQDAIAGNFTPSLSLVSRQIGFWQKRKTVAIKPPARSGFISQADINSPLRGRVVL